MFNRSRFSFSRREIKLGIIAGTIFVLCFRPIIAFVTYTRIDDLCYLKLVAKLFGVPVEGCVGGSYLPGVAVSWFPAGIVSYICQTVFNQSFEIVLPVFVGLLSFLYWAGSLIALDRIVISLLPSSQRCQWREVSSLSFLLNIPVLYYATHRTSLVHAPEIFLALLTVLYAVRRKPLLAFAFGLLLSLTRINDLPALAFPMVMTIGKRYKKNVWMQAAFLGVPLVLFFYLLWIGFGAGYHSTNVWKMLHRLSLNRLNYVFFGGDWGLMWSSPGWVLCLAWGIFQFRVLSDLARMGLVWMAFELLICLGWKGNGSDFGYRYTIGSFVGALLIGVDWIRLYPHRTRFFSALSGIFAVWIFWVGWIYKELPATTPYPTPDHGWTHSNLMLNSAQALLDVSNYWMPLRHSPLAAIYYSSTEVNQSLSLPGGSRGFSFWILVVFLVVLVASMVLIVLSHRSMRAKSSLKAAN